MKMHNTNTIILNQNKVNILHQICFTLYLPIIDNIEIFDKLMHKRFSQAILLKGTSLHLDLLIFYTL